jgi:hypothetical protein
MNNVSKKGAKCGFFMCLVRAREKQSKTGGNSGNNTAKKA